MRGWIPRDGSSVSTTSAPAWWVGAYTPDMEGTAEGIGVLLPREDGSLAWSHVAAATPSPTWVAERDGIVYAAAEGAGRVEAFRREGLSLTPLAGADAGGGWTCHLGFLDDAVVAANYQDGSLGVISLVDGAPAELLQVLPSEGSGPHPEQTGPHAHAAFRLDATTLLSTDLGADRIHIHTIEGSQLVRTGSLALPPGTGPRDLARHPSGLLHVLGEHGCTLTVLEWTGSGLEVVTTLTVPGSVVGDQAAAIGFAHDGRTVFAGVRGSNALSVMRSSADGRTLEPIGAVSTEGSWPRSHAVDGDLVHVANERSSSVVSMRIGADGIPSPIADPAPVPSPTHLLAVR